MAVAISLPVQIKSTSANRRAVAERVQRAMKIRQWLMSTCKRWLNTHSL